MHRYNRYIRLGMTTPPDIDLGSGSGDIDVALAELDRKVHRNQHILQKLQACGMSFADLEPSRQLVEDVRNAGLHVCRFCFTVDDPDLWGNGRDYRPACHCED
jgi:hypothetical protein